MAGWLSRQSRSVRLGIVLVALAAAAGTALVVASSFDHLSPADRSLAELRGLPLVGLVIKEEPCLEAKLRTVIEEELRSPTRNGPSRVFVALGDLRRNTIGPALASADDTAAMEVMRARAALVAHLQPSGPRFANDGIRPRPTSSMPTASACSAAFCQRWAAWRSLVTRRAPHANRWRTILNSSPCWARGGLSQADLRSSTPGRRCRMPICASWN